MNLYQVDAFTQQRFSGNPAAVCLLDEPREDEWMQAVASEMNLSETAFLLHKRDGWHLRWFTPVAEVDLCGHATVAAAHVLWSTGLLGQDEAARFTSASGPLEAVRDGAASGASSGPLMGYPVINVRVRVTGGSTRDGEGSEIGYQQAANEAASTAAEAAEKTERLYERTLRK